MGKLSQDSAKYIITARMEADGVVEKPDVVGAIFGQTEGLLGQELDLRELQVRGRVGRIDVDVRSSNGSSTAEIEIPTSLDATETALIAASLETLDRVGPCRADLEVESVDDVRVSKRDYIVDRAKELLEKMHDSTDGSAEITDEIRDEVRQAEVDTYQGLPAGPDVAGADEVVVVEGRADVVNLLRSGVTNAVAAGGTDVPDTITGLAEGCSVTLLLDGDRGGDLIQKEMMQTVDFDHVARAPAGREVEDLSKEEVLGALREKVPRDEAVFDGEDASEEDADGNTDEKPDLPEDDRETLRKLMDELVGTRAVYALDEEFQLLDRAPVDEFTRLMDGRDDVHAVLFDGRLKRSMVNLAESKGVNYLVGMSGSAASEETVCLTRDDL